MPVSSIGRGDLDKVWEIKTLKKEKDEEARRLLEMAAKQVQPIMRKRKWQVKLLSEFFPRNSGLLGLNIDGGREVRIRLRHHGRDWDFYPYESILGTLLHELTHNECGPHDAKFYKLLDEITKECEELMAKGISGTGQGFDARGQRLGGYTHNPPPTNLRAVALAAAEKRAKALSFMSGGPRRLGGDSEIMRALSPLQAAAMAAERRLRDDLWCAAPTTSGDDGLEKAKQREDANSPHPLGQYSTNSKSSRVSSVNRTFSNSEASTSEQVGRTSSGSAGDAAKRSSSMMVPLDPVGDAAITRAQKKGRSDVQSTLDRHVVENVTTSGNGEWACSVCTLHNPPLALACGACGSIREHCPAEQPTPFKTWTCKFCTLANLDLLHNNEACGACGSIREHPPAEQPTPIKTWTCKFCTLANLNLLDNCEACGQWRYSFGAPSASRAPNVGT